MHLLSEGYAAVRCETVLHGGGAHVMRDGVSFDGELAAARARLGPAISHAARTRNR